ncbi:hypothetical protein LCGC14_1898020 [marine sediment metagenome]|uniref:RecA family profile 2 domain-containing protein n=1 Tax=marine sediment metagenome TaxID=412755 RepID=A0A0F9IBA3_9ZZZZ
MPKNKKEPKKVKPGLDQALAKIEKMFGKGAIIRPDKNYKIETDSISTGSLELDLALGIGGLPCGRTVELFGSEGSGKTTLALSIIREVQKNQGKVAYIDAEHALDYDYARKIGVKLEDLLISQPNSGEEGLEVAQALIESGEVALIVIDSVAALTPQAEIDGTMSDAQIGLQARLMGKALRKMTGAISKTKTCVLFINQLRMKIGVMFGSPLVTPGGKALKFYASVRIDLRRVTTLKQGDKVIGTRVRAYVAKNKVAPPFRTAYFDIYSDEGLSTTGDVLNLAITHGIIDKSGSWFSYGKTQIGQGQEKARQYLKDNPKVFEEIKKQIVELLGAEK